MDQREVMGKGMLKGKDLILYSKRFAVENRSKSWYYTISTLLLLIVAFAGTFYNVNSYGKLLCSLISGLLIVRFFVIYHDYHHSAILQKSKLAKFIMSAFGIFVLAPSNIWKRTHDHHHHHNSKLTNHGIGSYPLLSQDDFNQLTKKEQFIYLAIRHPITIFFGYLTLFTYDFNITPIMKNPKFHWDSALALVLHVCIGFLIYSNTGLFGLFLSQTFPFLIANGLGAYLFYAQHNFPGATFDDKENWKYVNAALNSTSFIEMNPVMAWFTGNIGYHHVHHVNHRIPFYRLKEAVNDMPELQHPKTTSLHPKDIWRCLRLKVWNPRLGKMTGL